MSTYRGLGLIGLLLVLVASGIGLLQLIPPSLNSPASDDSFSAERALDDIVIIASSPRPMATPAHSMTRDYLLERLEGLGLTAHLQEAFVVTQGFPRVGRVSNVVGRLEGTETDDAVLLVAHYDTVPLSPGAADNGAALAAVLEAIRALKAGPPVRNDIIVLFTDGEEGGLLGAIGFLEQHPWARDVAIVLNFDARGSTGSSLMFETSNGNEKLIKGLVTATSAPVASSVMSSLYRYMPNSTDFSIFKRAGLPGLNFAFIGGAHTYHSTEDELAHLDVRSVQHHGLNALQTARFFGNQDLRELSSGSIDAVYFNIFRGWLISYPSSWILPLALFAFALFGGVAAIALRNRSVKFREVCLSASAYLLVMALGVGVSVLLLHLLGYILADHVITRHSGVLLTGILAMSVAAIAAAYAWLSSRLSVVALLAGVLSVWTLLLVGVTASAPEASYIVTWPLLFGTAGLALLTTLERNPSSRRWFAALVVCVVPGALLLTPILALLLVAMGPRMVAVGGLGVGLLLGLFIPFLARPYLPKYIVPVGALITGGVLLGAAVVRGSSMPDQHRDLFYLVDVAEDRAFWASSDLKPVAWIARLFGEDAVVRDLQDYHPGVLRPFLTSPAPALSLPAPAMTILHDHVQDTLRIIRLHIGSGQRVPMMMLFLRSDQHLQWAKVDGQHIPTNQWRRRKPTPESWYEVDYLAMPAEGADFTLAFYRIDQEESHRAIQIRLTNQYHHLPAELGFTPEARPPSLLPDGGRHMYVSYVTRAFSL